MKVYLKLTKNNIISESNNNFFIKSDNKTLIYQKDHIKKRKFTFDYIFSDEETSYTTSNILREDIIKYLKIDKNLFFLTFGQEKLGNIFPYFYLTFNTY